MAGSPIKRERMKILDELGEDGVLRVLLEEGTITKMCRAIFPPPPNKPNSARYGHNTINQWVRRGGVEREEWWKQARRTLADVMVDDATETLDEATIQDVRLKAEQARQKRWVAGILNPDYSGKTSVNVNNNTVQVFGNDLAQALQALDNREISQPTHTTPIRPDSVGQLAPGNEGETDETQPDAADTSDGT